MRPLDHTLETQLRILLRAFLEENQKLNLSALRTEDTCWHGNFLDALPFVDIREQIKPLKTLLDLGTGGGFPLLPIALSLPEVQCTGMDSTGKKILAVQRIIDAMRIPNAKAIAGRAEDLAKKPEHRGEYDVVTARAVAALPVLLEYASAFAKVGGHIVLWKSVHIDDEMAASKNAQKVLHCPFVFAHSYTLPGDWGTRQLLVFKKEKMTYALYPRPASIIGKQPL